MLWFKFRGIEVRIAYGEHKQALRYETSLKLMRGGRVRTQILSLTNKPTLMVLSTDDLTPGQTCLAAHFVELLGKVSASELESFSVVGGCLHVRKTKMSNQPVRLWLGTSLILVSQGSFRSWRNRILLGLDKALATDVLAT